MLDQRLILLLKRLGLLVAVYSLLRLIFLAFNYQTFAEAEMPELLLALVHGIRFDLSVLLTINLLFIALSLLPRRLQRKKLFQQTLLFVYLIVNLPFIFLNLVDTEFFKFIGRRSTNEVFTISVDIADQAGQLAFNYWYFLVAGLFFVLLFIRLYPKYKKTDQPFQLRGFTFGVMLLVALLIVAIRGGLQLKPLRPTHAFVHKPPVLGNLVLNSSFTFFRSLSAKSLEPKHFFKTWNQTIAHLNHQPEKYLSQPGPAIKDNVVIIILESFASEYTGIENNGQGYTPFFDSLATEGLFFREHYANGRKSIDALPSVLAGLPALMDEPVITSQYQSNTLYGLGTLVGQNGYNSSFFHGAKNGTMGFNGFSKVAGFDKYYGLDQYQEDLKKQHFDGKWGIFDEPYLQYFATELSKHRQPFLSTVFTLSSHQPYSIPENYKGRFPKGTLEIHESIGYADYALRQFFKTASQQPWYQNTLFILLADHTQKVYRKEYQNNLGLYKTPLLLFHPRKKLSGNPQKITQQVDILPTVVDYLNLKTNKVLPFGESVLDTSSTGRAIFYTGGFTILLHRDYITQLTADNQLQLYPYHTHGETYVQVKNERKKEEYGNELKALLQYYTNGLIENKLYYWLKEKTD